MSQVAGPQLVTTTRFRRRNSGIDRAGPRSYLFLIMALLIAAFPLYWMVVVATNVNEVMSEVPPRVVPGDRLFINLGKMFANVDFLQALLNSLIVSSCIAISVVFFSTLAGFAFAKL